VKLVTVAEAAVRLGFTSETLLRWIRRGKLPAIKTPGGHLRIREDDLERCLHDWATPARKIVTRPEQDTADGTRYPGTLRPVTHSEGEEE
jgi:excisionase family DNA binding protein